jgi:hypothetical protein
MYRKDRATSAHGGVLIAVRSDIQSCSVDVLTSDSEIIWVSIKSKTGEILIGSAYRSPSSTECSNKELLRSLADVSYIQHRYENILLLGDFNLCKLG